MSGASTDEENAARGAPSWALWIAATLAVAVCGLVLVLWGVGGPAYIIDLIVAFCG